ncbi:MAG: hypothetical protein ABR606_21140 [Vicinamibacterales bacterium]
MQLYEQAALKAPREPAVRAGFFGASLLAGLRAKELALRSEPYFARARALVTTLESTTPAAPTLLAIAEAVSPAPPGLAAEDRERLVSNWNNQQQRLAEDWRRALAEPSTPPLLRAYQGALVVCREPAGLSALEQDSALQAVADAPLVTFRFSLCRHDPIEADWPEARFFEAVRRLAMQDRWWEAVEIIREAATTFPESPLIRLALADALRDRDPDEALREYDAVSVGGDDVLLRRRHLATLLAHHLERVRVDTAQRNHVCIRVVGDRHPVRRPECCKELRPGASSYRRVVHRRPLARADDVIARGRIRPRSNDG